MPQQDDAQIGAESYMRLTADSLTPRSRVALHFGMLFWSLVDALSPYARLTTAVAPFAAATILRFAMGRNKVTAWLVSIATMWFLVNVLIAPYSEGMRDDLHSIQSMLR